MRKFQNSTSKQNLTYPILRGDYPDPTILRCGNKYYMTHSCGKYRPGLLIWHSDNLMDWRPLCFALENMGGDIWAPDLVCNQGKYYIYFTVFGSNWVVTADSMEGPWSQPVDLHIPLIDPGHCTDEDGNRYLFFSNGYLAQLSSDGLSIQGKVQKVYDGWHFPDEWHTEGFCLESPKILRRNGYYYLTVAEGGTAGPATAHMAVSARAQSLFGPWENSPYNPIIHCSGKEEIWWNKGHGTIIDSPTGQWWIVYHAYEKDYRTLGRSTLLDPLEWTDDGWFHVTNHAGSNWETVTNAGYREYKSTFYDDFSSLKPSTRWRFFQDYDMGRYTYTGKGVQITGKGTLPEILGSMSHTGADYVARGELIGESNPMTCMADAHSYEAICKLELSGKVEAGILLFYNKKFFCGFGFDGRSLNFIKNGRPCGHNSLASSQIYLRLVNEDNDVSFYYSEDGRAWKNCGLYMDVSGYFHNVLGGYLSLRPGLYVIGDGSVLFRFFRYRSLC